MPKKIDIQIKESKVKLAELLKDEWDKKRAHRVEMLYLIKAGEENYKRNLADRLGYSRTTIDEWLKRYEEGGMKSLLSISKSPGAPTKFPKNVRQGLVKKLNSKHTFRTYVDIQRYLKDKYDLELPYSTVHDYVRYQLNFDLKANVKQVAVGSR